jgi:tetratricopeptide (TPR) repeat protein
MDGRRLRKWWLSGCLVVGAFGCSNRNTLQPPWGTTPAAQPVTGMPMTPAKKSFWDRSQPAVPIEVVETVRKGPAKPETHAAFATAQLDAAFDEKTIPAGRETLLDHARQGYQKALQLDPKNKPALLGLANYYVRLGEREKAIEVYKKYLATYPKDKDVVHDVAMAHAKWKDWAGAVAWCEYALKLDPENLTYRKTMAFCLARAGKWEDSFTILCQIMPEAQARYLVARILEHQNQPEACRMQLQLAIKADPNHAEARDFLVELDQGYRFDVPQGSSDLKLAGGTEPDPQP